MQRTGIAKLPLHYGKAPEYLLARMKKLANAIITIMIDEHGSRKFLERVSDPFWFQALGCVTGYDWHSSGVTTVVTRVLKEAVKPELHGIAVCGGKGRISRNTPNEIASLSSVLGFSNLNVEKLCYSSRMAAKVDSAAIQAGYTLYHHAFFITSEGDWAVVQQGMCPADRSARRYHWLSGSGLNFVVEPHKAVAGEVKRQSVLNMTAKESEACRRTCVDVAKTPTKKVMQWAMSESQKTLDSWTTENRSISEKSRSIKYLLMPRNINWKTLSKIYEFQPRNYEELLSQKGVGPATVRGLALIADLLYGTEPCWRDPVKYSFAYGGKDGVPFPVDRKAMDQSIEVLREAIEGARLGNDEKIRSLRKLSSFVSNEMP